MEAKLKFVFAHDLSRVILDLDEVRDEIKGRLALESVVVQINAVESRPVHRLKRIGKTQRSSVVSLIIASAPSMVVTRSGGDQFVRQGRGERPHPCG